MPIPSAILSIILEYIYTNDAPMVRSCTDIELLCNTLTLSDQLLIGRLKEICEVALVDLSKYNIRLVACRRQALSKTGTGLTDPIISMDKHAVM